MKLTALLWLITGAVITAGLFLFLRPDAPPEVVPLAPELETYDAIRAEREARLADSLLAQVDPGVNEDVFMERMRLIREQHNSILAACGRVSALERKLDRILCTMNPRDSVCARIRNR